MDCIVTGGAGFIGSNLVERLVKDGHNVYVFDNLTTGSERNLNGVSAEITKYFTLPYWYMNLGVEKADVVFHLGIPSSSPIYKQDRRQVGIALTDFIDVLEFCKDHNSKLIYASSSSLYNGNSIPWHETMQIYVTDFYTESRRAMERVASLYHTIYGVKSVGLRFFSVYGPKEEYKRNYANLVSQFLWDMKNGTPPLIYGDGSQARDFIYVDDVVEAMLLAAAKNFGAEIFNVGTGQSYSLNQLIKILNDLLGTQITPEYKANPIKNYVPHTLADTRKAYKYLGFKAKIDLKEGIKKIM